MKQLILGALAMIGMTMALTAAPVEVAKGRVAVVYFSWSPDGNTRFAAQTIAAKAEAKLFEIKAEKSYSTDYRSCTQEAKPECDGKKLRAIKPLSIDLKAYDAVFVGTPNWWGTMAPPVRTWVSQNAMALRGKTVCLFQTNGGGGMQRVGKDFAELLPQSKVLPPAAFSGSRIKSSVKELEKFVDERIAMRTADDWDKVFPKSDKVEHGKVSFKNRYGILLVADLYKPKGTTGKLVAIAVSGPFGAVKEQVSGLYAQHMAERGFLTIAFDPSFTGESAGEPRRMASPDINTEDFLAAVDYLSNRNEVDANKIGIIGICGWGGMALNAAALDPRIKATVASTMYDMTRVTANGYNDADDSKEKRDVIRRAIAAQRTEDFKNGTYKDQAVLPNPEQLTADTPQFVKEYVDFYKTPRGYHKRSVGSNEGWRVIGCQSFLNQPLLAYANEIRTPVLLIHGEKAHSRYFSEGAFEKMTGQKPTQGKTTVVGNKELMIIPGAVHTALYDDRAGVIPYDYIEKFFRDNLK